MNININPKKILSYFLCLLLVLLLANIVGIVATLNGEQPTGHGLIPILDFNKELSIPTLFSTLALLFVSILLAFIGSAHKRLGSSYYPWVGLAMIFLYLSFDETVSIHEELTTTFRVLLNTKGLFYYAWVIPYGIAFIFLAMLYFKFILTLPFNIMFLFVVSGTIYISGALGFEMIGARHHYYFGQQNLLHAVYYTIEEFLEMLGLIIFIYTLLLYITDHLNFNTISFRQFKDNVQ